MGEEGGGAWRGIETHAVRSMFNNCMIPGIKLLIVLRLDDRGENEKGKGKGGGVKAT